MSTMTKAASVEAGVAVFGHSRADTAACAQAEAVGAVLGQGGYTVINGGYGGTMEASARGARDAGAEVVGVTCRAWKAMPNALLTRTIETEDLSSRVATLIGLATAGFVVLPGGTGTLVELATAWELMNKGLIAPRPLACVGEFWRPVVEQVLRAQNDSAEHVLFADDAQQLSRFFPPLGRNC